MITLLHHQIHSYSLARGKVNLHSSSHILHSWWDCANYIIHCLECNTHCGIYVISEKVLWDPQHTKNSMCISWKQDKTTVEGVSKWYSAELLKGMHKQKTKAIPPIITISLDILFVCTLKSFFMIPCILSIIVHDLHTTHWWLITKTVPPHPMSQHLRLLIYDPE